MPILLPHAFAARSGGDLVLLDVREDAYSLIVDAVPVDDCGGAVLWPTGIRVRSDAADAIVEAGMAVADAPLDGPVPEVLGTIARRPWSPAARRPAGRDVLDLVIAWIGAAGTIRGGVPPHAFHRTRTTAAPDRSFLAAQLDALSSARLLVPTPTRCLPACLIAQRFLGQRGIASELVFGVRTHPFVAHCWLEAGGLLLDDEPDRVVGYAPICVARP